MSGFLEQGACAHSGQDSTAILQILLVLQAQSYEIGGGGRLLVMNSVNIMQGHVSIMNCTSYYFQSQEWSRTRKFFPQQLARQACD